jgi:hypothetical protein
MQGEGPYWTILRGFLIKIRSAKALESSPSNLKSFRKGLIFLWFYGSAAPPRGRIAGCRFFHLPQGASTRLFAVID